MKSVSSSTGAVWNLKLHQNRMWSGEVSRFKADDLVELFEENVVAVEKQEKTLFSHVVIDSDSGPGRAFAKACEDNEDVHFYIKLPRWFLIETPVGTYNPDWGVDVQERSNLIFRR